MFVRLQKLQVNCQIAGINATLVKALKGDRQQDLKADGHSGNGR